MKKTKKEWIKWFLSLDDNVEIDLHVASSVHNENGKLKKITICGC